MTTRRLLQAALTATALTAATCTVGLSQPITITDWDVDKTSVRPGEALTVRIMAGGGANYCVRHNEVGPDDVLPGWQFHAPRYAFVPSGDFPGKGPYKNPYICHKDNGERDLDERRGVFAIKIDTAGWPEGTYSLSAMATNRPAVGSFRGDLRHFVVTVSKAPDRVDPGEDRSPVRILVNGKAAGSNEGPWPVFPGVPNRMTLEADPARVGPAGWRVELTRRQPDGRTSRRSANLSAQKPEIVMDLGLFAVPAEYDFEAGAVFRRGCRLELEVRDPATGKTIERHHFLQDVGATGRAEVLRARKDDRVAHYGGPRGLAFHPMDPPILLRLAPEVLADPDDVRVIYQLRAPQKRLRPERSLLRIPAVLRVTRHRDGTVMVEKALEVLPGAGTEKLDAADWPEGRYRMEISPQVDGTTDREGPVVEYRRAAPEPGVLPLSPLAPWQFERDAAREELVVRDLRGAVERWSPGPPDAAYWQYREADDGDVRLVCTTGDWEAPPVILRPELKGHYAVLAETEGGWCYLRVGKDDVARGVREGPVFVRALDMTGDEVAVCASVVPGSGLRGLRFVPVTAESVRRVMETTSRPPTPLRGVADWCDIFAAPPVHHSAGGRLAEDQFDMLLQGHAELGMRSIAWSIGRSWIEYHSRLPGTTRFPCVPLETVDEKYREYYAGRAQMVNQYRPLAYVLGHRDEYGLDIYPWLAMQRHYGEKAYGGIFASEWFKAHPEWRRWGKNASGGSGSTVCYFFPEVRKERVDIFCEVAERGPDGLVIGCCRQVPMLLYHPEMVAAYRQKTGVDPQEIDAHDGPEYEAWIRWRADFFTETLRELKERLEPIRARTGRPIPVVVRLPSKGLFYNLAQGLDVETWCLEGLVDQMQLDPLEDCEGRGGPHDVRPYLELGRRHGVRVLGGINGNTFSNYTAIMKRALGLLGAGVEGIEFYESNNFCVITDRRWIIPLLGTEDRPRRFLETSNVEACHPVWARNAAAGFDNHSFGGRWSVFGGGGNAL